MSNLVHIAEIAVLLLAAYLVGCVLGYALRRLALVGKKQKTAGIPAERIAAVTGGAALVTAPAIGPVASASGKPSALSSAAEAAMEAAIANAISTTTMAPLAGVAQLPKFAPLSEPLPLEEPAHLQPATRPGEVRFDPNLRDDFPEFEPPTSPALAVAAATAAVVKALAGIDATAGEAPEPVRAPDAGGSGGAEQIDELLVAVEPPAALEIALPAEPESVPVPDALVEPVVAFDTLDAPLPEPLPRAELATAPLAESAAQGLPEAVTAQSDPVAAAEWFVTAQIEPILPVPPVAPPAAANRSEDDEAAAMRAIEGGWTRSPVPRSGT